ncbi:hypothetical protein PDUR_22440 [Paenibacillus durus]|uniref:Uncharacterized protein n=1 Tax=Paenibacillus durus TaxID=44251 RepID=A0A089HUD6_PAEDU|nr:hypothetical protein PDUR_22440 [Paenibacillus durus]
MQPTFCDFNSIGLFIIPKSGSFNILLTRKTREKNPIDLINKPYIPILYSKKKYPSLKCEKKFKISQKAKKDAKRMFSVCSILIGPPILITGRDEGGPDDINKSANENAGNYAHHHHSIPEY